MITNEQIKKLYKESRLLYGEGKNYEQTRGYFYFFGIHCYKIGDIPITFAEEAAAIIRRERIKQLKGEQNWLDTQENLEKEGIYEVNPDDYFDLVIKKDGTTIWEEGELE
jgi:hypothetical protein